VAAGSGDGVRTGRETVSIDLCDVFDLHAVELLDDFVEFAVEFVDELNGALGLDRSPDSRARSGSPPRGLEASSGPCGGVSRLVRHLDDPDRFVLDNHLQDLQMTFQHIDFLLKSVYHGIC